MRLPAAGQHLLALSLAIVTAGLQLVVACQWEGRSGHISAVALGWGGSLWLAWLEHDSWKHATTCWAESAIGAAIVAGTWLVVLHGRAEYSLPNRFMPILAGVGIFLIAAGVRSVGAFWRQLLLLGLPLAYPLPYAVRVLVTPTPVTAAASGWAMRLLGFTVERQGTLLVFPNSTLRVLELCSGIHLMTQLGLLATLVVCLVPTTFRRAVAVLATGVAIGFLVNAARITMLGIVAYRTPAQFDYWEEYASSSVLVPAIATAVSGLVWWGIMRRGPSASHLENRPQGTTWKAE